MFFFINFEFFRISKKQISPLNLSFLLFSTIDQNFALPAPSSSSYSHKLPLSDLIDRPSPSYALRKPIVPYYGSNESLSHYRRRDPITSSYDTSSGDRLWELQHSPGRYRPMSPARFLDHHQQHAASNAIERYSPSRFSSLIGSSTELQRVLPFLTTKLQDTRIEMAQPAQLKCHALGGRPSTIKWFKNGREIKQDGRMTLYSARDMSVLDISRATLTDTGLYRAEVHNELGTTSYYCMLRVTRRMTSILYKDLPFNSDPEYTFQEGEVIRVINRLPNQINEGTVFTFFFKFYIH